MLKSHITYHTGSISIYVICIDVGAEAVNDEEATTAVAGFKEVSLEAEAQLDANITFSYT